MEKDSDLPGLEDIFPGLEDMFPEDKWTYFLKLDGHIFKYCSLSKPVAFFNYRTLTFLRNPVTIL